MSHESCSAPAGQRGLGRRNDDMAWVGITVLQPAALIEPRLPPTTDGPRPARRQV